MRRQKGLWGVVVAGALALGAWLVLTLGMLWSTLEPHEQAQVDNEITGALRQLFALAEAYPDLKANQGFVSLQEELANTESRIAYARQFYGDAVEAYNNAIQAFPGVLVAKTFGFGEREYFEAEVAAREVPKVQF